MPDLTPNTGDWHAHNVGMLIANLQSLEFSGRVAIATMAGAQPIVDLLSLQPGQWVPEDPMTNYDQLSVVLGKFNTLASSRRQVDVTRIVELRDQLAHGRTAAGKPTFPLTLLKFDKPAKGQVQVLARIEMTDAWFREQRTLVHNAIQAVVDEGIAWDSRRGR